MKKLDLLDDVDDAEDSDEGLLFFRRRAVIDQNLLNNDKAEFSYATSKYKWGGEGGAFNTKDLSKWLKVYN